MKIEVAFILEDKNGNGKPDLRAEVRAGSMVFSTPPLDGPSFQEMLALAGKLVGLGKP